MSSLHICHKLKAPGVLVFSALVAFILPWSPATADKGVTDYLPATPAAPGASAGTPSQGSAQSLSGGVSRSAPIQGGASHTNPLQGGVKEESSLNPSLRLTPQFQGQAGANNGQGGSLKPGHPQYVPETIRGGVHAAGSEGGISAGPVQFFGGTPRGGDSGMHGIISPISSYHHTPASGVVNYIPGASSSFSSKGGTQSQEAMPRHFQTIGRGVTVLSPDLTVTSAARIPELPLFGSGGGGIGSVLSNIQSFAVQMITPGTSGGTKIWNCLGGNDGTHYVTRGGITTAPGYEVTISPPGLSKETLGGRWSTNPIGTTELRAIANPMETQHIFNRIEPAAEIARAGVLAQFQAGKTDTWPQWYRTVARAIYTHWQMVDVCPGTAKLEVTIKSNHDISAQVVDFTPAADIERNVPRETEFREMAVKIVDQLSFFEIPEFPNPPTNQVVFDIDLKRTVDGPTGATVVGMPSK